MKKSVNSLRLGRTLVAIVVFSLLVGLFADYGQTVPAVASWLAKVQIFPAAMAFSLATFVIWLIVTLLFGRIYCSTFCPLGIYQDLCSRLPRMRRRVKPRWHYHYSLPHTSLRHISLFIVVLSIFLGISAVTSFFDPYSVFGRFGLNVVRPIWGEILNAWYEIEKQPQLRVAVASGLGISIAVVTMLIVGLIAFLHGRTLCNSAIGRDGDLLYHISEDQKRFKSLTMGHPIIMGRRTFESFPKGALPGRRNIVVTRNQAYKAPGIEAVSSFEKAIALCGPDSPAPYIIGGEEIYRQALSTTDRIELTLIDAVAPDADTLFPKLGMAEWSVWTEHGLQPFNPDAITFEHTDPRTSVSYAFLTLVRTRM